MVRGGRTRGLPSSLSLPLDHVLRQSTPICIFLQFAFRRGDRSESEAKLASARAMRLLPAGEPVRKRHESRKHLRRQDRVRLQNSSLVNIIDFTGVSYARDVNERRRPEDALLTKVLRLGFILLIDRRFTALTM